MARGDLGEMRVGTTSSKVVLMGGFYRDYLVWNRYPVFVFPMIDRVDTEGVGADLIQARSWP